jgi:hypothetical protein
VKWEKLGLIVAPNPDVWWMACYAGPSFVRVKGESWEIFVTGRDINNESRIGRVFGVWTADGFTVRHVDADPVFDVGEIGTFDESGVSYPWIVEEAGSLLMYYVGWVSGGKSRFQNYTGLARSEDDGKTWVRTARIPLLDRNQLDPFGTGSCCVFHDGEQYVMYYTAFEEWIPDPAKNSPTYNLKIAVSDDGYSWMRSGEVAVGFAQESEHVIGKPSILIADSVRHLWYSCRGAAYRIGYARAEAGERFVRCDDAVGILPSASGWDSEMIEYAHVFRDGYSVFMVYNGDNFGKTGLGLAKLEGPLR